jgi:hypothetical protein
MPPLDNNCQDDRREDGWRPLGLILEWKMMMNWKGYGKNRSCRYFGHYPDICEETEKARENVSKTGILAEI